MAVVSWYVKAGSQDIVAAWLVGKLVAGGPEFDPAYPVVPFSHVGIPQTRLLKRVLTPCWYSFHHAYSCTPRRGIGAASVLGSCEAFSASVIRDTRSAARSAGE